MRIKLGKDGKPKKKTGPKPKNVVAPGGPFNCKDCGRQFNNRRQVRSIVCNRYRRKMYNIVLQVFSNKNNINTFDFLGLQT